jgi:hypothetical protein
MYLLCITNEYINILSNNISSIFVKYYVLLFIKTFLKIKNLINSINIKLSNGNINKNEY